MRLYFIRHGQSVNNALFSLTQSSKDRVEDPPLTDKGVKQAESLADFFGKNRDIKLENTAKVVYQKFNITHLYCSLMTRAIQTGIIISKKLNVPLIAWEEIHEAGGVFKIEEVTGNYLGVAGNNNNYFSNEFPAMLLRKPISSEGWWNRPFESNEQRKKRAKVVIRELVTKYKDEDEILMISHRAFYNVFMRELFNIEDENLVWFELYNASITRVDFLDEKQIGLVYMNRHEFLGVELLTI